MHAAGLRDAADGALALEVDDRAWWVKRGGGAAEEGGQQHRQCVRPVSCAPPSARHHRHHRQCVAPDTAAVSCAPHFDAYARRHIHIFLAHSGGNQRV